MKPLPLTLALLAPLAFAACTDFTEGKNVAEMVPPATEPAAQIKSAEAASTAEQAEVLEPANDTVYAFTDESVVVFEGSKVIDTRVGGFPVIGGTITLEGDDPTTARLDLTIDATALYSDAPLLTKVLKGKDFFDVENHPTAAFVSISVKEAGDSGYIITGDLTIKGITRRLSFPAQAKITPERITGEAEFVIDRTQWDVGYHDWKGQIIKNDVLLSLLIEAERREQAPAS